MDRMSSTPAPAKWSALVAKRLPWWVLLVVVFVVGVVVLYSNVPGATNRRHRQQVGGAGVREKMTWKSPTGVWPRSNEIDDRIQSQLDFADVYRRARDGAKHRRRNSTEGGTPPSSSFKYIFRVGDFNFEGWLEGRQQFVKDKCPIVDCWLMSTDGRPRSADALLISEFNDKVRSRYLPKPARQIWIAQHMESPRHNRIDPGSLRGLVNWSATYRRDSTIVRPYGWNAKVPVGIRPSPPPSPEVNYAAGKTKKVAWLVSNCANGNGRQSYTNELAKFIDVDVYGRCGKLSCPNGGLCHKMLKTDYKFYLAFENSHCVGYITEKLFWNALK